MAIQPGDRSFIRLSFARFGLSEPLHVLLGLRNSSNELVGFVKVTRDLTEQRKMEEERLRLAHAEEAIRLRDEWSVEGQGLINLFAFWYD